MIETITKIKYGIAIMADLEGAFDSVWRLGALYKLHKARISEKFTFNICKLHEKPSTKKPSKHTYI